MTNEATLEASAYETAAMPEAVSVALSSTSNMRRTVQYARRRTRNISWQPTALSKSITLEASARASEGRLFLPHT